MPEHGEQDQVDLLQALGGARGIADSGLPALGFVAAYTLGGQDVSLAAWIAVGIAG